MKLNSIVNRYIFKEFIPPFVINIAFLVFVFLMAKILKITDMVINYNIGLGDVLLIILYTIPYFLVFVIPISTMLTILLTFLRMCVDNEVIAIRAGGVAIYSLLAPVLCLCLITTGLTFGMAFYGTPWGRLALKELTYRVAASNLKAGLKERVFNTDFKDVTMYVAQIDKNTTELIDVFIEDRRNHKLVNTIVATRGILFNDQENLVPLLRLLDGTINQVNLKEQSASSIKFGSYDISLDFLSPGSPQKSKRKDHTEMNLFEYHSYFQHAKQTDSHYYSLLTKYHNKFSIAFSCISLGLLAVPLGCLSRNLKGSIGIGLGIMFLILYYALISVGKVYCETGDLPPSIVMWIPNVLILFVAGLFFYLSADNRAFSLSRRH